MKPNLLFILLALVIGLFVSSTVLYRQWREAEEKARSAGNLATLAISDLNEERKTSVTLKNELGQVWNANSALQIEAKHKEEALRVMGLKLDRAQKKRLEQATRVDAVIDQTVKPEIVPSDTVPGLECPPTQFSYTSADSLNNVVFDGDSLTVKIAVPLQGIITRGKRTKKFLFIRVGPRSIRSEFHSPNPWVEIKDHRVVFVKE